MHKKYHVKCEICGNEVVKSNQQRTCSKECRSELQRIERIKKRETAPCPICGNVALLYYKAHDVYCCSARCRDVHNSRLHTQKNGRPARVGAIAEKAERAICPICEKEFKPRRYDQRCCSVKCNDSWQSKYGEKAENLKRKKIERRKKYEIEIGQCSLCGTNHNDILSPRELGMGGASYGLAKFHTDHIRPSANGGSDDESNKRVVCWFCNMNRKNLDVMYDEAIASSSRIFWEKVKRLRKE